MSAPKKIPKFKSQAEEKRFWEQHDSANYIDWKKAKRVVFPNLKPSVKTISLRLPEHLLNAIKMMANKEDVPYQSLMKMMLAKSIEEASKNTVRKRRSYHAKKISTSRTGSRASFPTSQMVQPRGNE